MQIKTILFVTIFTFFVFSANAEKKNKQKEWKQNTDKIVEAVKKAKNWLISQQVPNKTVPEKVREGLILSYDVPKGAPGYKYIYSKSFLYDNALSLIAFTMIGHNKEAWKIINALMRTSKDGLFFFNYNTHNTWPTSDKDEGILVRNGASAWMVYALTFFLQANLKKDPKFLTLPEVKPLIPFLKMAVDKILNYRYNVKNYALNGYISGGWGNYKLTVNKAGKAEEVYSATRIPWISIEHSIDIYFMFKALLSLNLAEFNYLKEPYEFYRDNLVKDFWNDKTKQFNRGWSKSAKDEALALDAASWGAIYLQSIGRKDLAKLALKSTKNYENWRSLPRGHIPYLNMTIHEDAGINRHFYPEDPDKTWNKLDFSWWEGTFGVLLAYRKVHGKHPGIDKKLLDFLKVQQKDGSFLYATQEIPFQFSPYPSVASTAWFIITTTCFLVEDFNDLFWN